MISFDYAIKYLIRDKGDYSIVEGFISALLKTKGYKNVKIVALLESESNKEDPKEKKEAKKKHKSDNGKVVGKRNRNGNQTEKGKGKRRGRITGKHNYYITNQATENET